MGDTPTPRLTRVSKGTGRPPANLVALEMPEPRSQNKTSREAKKKAAAAGQKEGVASSRGEVVAETPQFKIGDEVTYFPLLKRGRVIYYLNDRYYVQVPGHGTHWATADQLQLYS